MGNKNTNPNPPKSSINFGITIKRIYRYLSKYKKSLIVAIITSIISTIFVVLGPMILGSVTNIIADGSVNIFKGTGGIDFNKIGYMLILLLCVYIIAQVFSYIQIYIMSKVSQKAIYNLRKDVIIKINNLPLKFFDTNSQGDILSRITSDIENINTSLQQILTQFITSLVTIVGIIAMMFLINFWMTIVALLTVPLSLLFSMIVIKNSQKFYKGQQEYLGKINGLVEEVYSGHNIIKTFNQEKRSIKKFEDLNDKLYKNSWTSQFATSIMMPVITLASNIGYVLISILGGYLVVQGVIGVGRIQSFIQYIKNFMMPISQIAQVMNVLQSTVASADRVFGLLDQEEEIKEKNTLVIKEDIKGDVTFDNITFGYNKENPLINNCNIEIKQGQKIAIVGPTGAGKTTLINLLMRFYDADKGCIKIDGINIYDITREDLRSLYGMVLQDTWLFKGSIKDNIAYGKLGATDEEIINTSKMVYADQFIRTLPDGYDMILNEEASNVSAGQKQLLTIARAVISNPKILILDEATSSVDTRTEVLIQKAMNKIMKNRTTFVIAHRLSTIKDADIIMVMKDGDIIEHGRHDDLILNEDGFYKILYYSQFENN